MSKNLKYHEYLGGGAGGSVYRATWKSKEFGTIEAAAKKIRIDSEITTQLKQEIEFLKRLNHKNIIKYYDTVLEKEYVVIVTEYAAKGSLYAYLKDKDKLPKHLLHRWIFHLARGVNYLKKNDLAHRDLKSPNCVLTADDVLKICDFGIAKDLTSTKTTENVIGSFRWMAPELITESQLSPKGDIFAFGIIVWEMVSCEVPYKGMRNEYVMFQVSMKGLRPKIPDDCPQFLKELMTRCWHQDRTQRPESLEILRSVWNEYRPTLVGETITEADGLEWKLKHEIDSKGELCFVASDHLAICRLHSVEVHHVSREETHLLYTLRSDEWVHGVFILGAVVSASVPDGILVACRNKSYVYKLPMHEASNHVEKYQIHNWNGYPYCIAANANTAVIGLSSGALVVCNLPGFTQQRIVSISFIPHHLSISTEYLVVMGKDKMVIKALGDVGQDLCSIQPPHGCLFHAVSYRNDARQLYAACYQGAGKGPVYKYIWHGNGTPSYHNTGCVIEDVGDVLFRGLSVTSDGILAVSTQMRGTRIFSFE
ncbi:mitogen-activated protein kinase kinase kinase 13-like [Amphiura filiformis]|uniref:mitogen-activated protein kinase kinase kinase 13-like n=1 Tax=Amphiura filiformis TaxID=82378 RepID=UPI003B226CE2